MNLEFFKKNTPILLTNNQKGFTLIELIMVIVLLGLLAVVAVPKYVDLKTDAENAQANGVLAAAEGAAAINFANNLINDTGDLIDDGTALMAALDGTPTGWTVDGDTITNTNLTNITPVITVTTDETTTAKAVLTGSGW